jgi:acyl CoA:acetate/3-ketoacid CoA transferase beta subunit
VTPRGLVVREIATDTTLDHVRRLTGTELIAEDEPQRF